MDNQLNQTPTMSEKLKALVIDDEADNLDLLRRVMRSGYEVLSAESGEEALKFFQDHDFSVILSDQRMPGMSGTEFFEESIKRQPSTIRILITGYSDIDSVIDAINKGSVHRYIKKPWKRDELLRQIQETLETQRLIVENQRMVKELKETNVRLKEHEKLLMQNLDERSKQLYELNQELRELNEKLKGQSLRDGLTNLYNHRAFQQRLREEFSRSQRKKAPITLVFLDVDHFKNFNDTHGHSAGDDLLRSLASLLSDTSRSKGSGVRTSDIISRYGGEEFAVILPDTPLEGGLIKAERIRKSIASHKFPGMEKQPLKHLSVSIGVANFPEHAKTPERLIELADQAMYKAKKNGRNQVQKHKET